LSRKTRRMKQRSIGIHKTQKLKKIHFNRFVHCKQYEEIASERR
jgi:hypothetical protein